MVEIVGIKCMVLEKFMIELLKMGGLLVVNCGFMELFMFIIFEYKLVLVVNKKFVVLVGKGVVYDIGGLSFKLMFVFMDFMKSDMVGVVVVVGIIFVVVEFKLFVYLIVFILVMDNCLGENVYVLGDIIEMYNGIIVEVLNMDVEGCMILVDVFSYLDWYKLEFVIDVVILIGVVVCVIGIKVFVIMGNVLCKYF